MALVSEVVAKIAARCPGSPSVSRRMSSAERMPLSSSEARADRRALHEMMIDLRVLPAAALNAR